MTAWRRQRKAWRSQSGRGAAARSGLIARISPERPARAEATTLDREAAPSPSAGGALSRRGPFEPSGGRRVAPRDEGGKAEALGHPPIGQRRALRRDNGAAGRCQHRVAGGHIPFTRGRKARIDVGGAFGELTE